MSQKDLKKYANYKSIRPKDVLKFKKPTKDFLCPINANTFGVQFQEFTIRDLDTKEVIYKTSLKDQKDVVIDYNNLDKLRMIKYTFKKSFLTAKTIGTTVVFSIGEKPVKSFRMIERHYFHDKLLKSFDFKFTFCIPKSTNSWECIYDFPKISKKTKEKMLNEHYKTKSDSFYFVGEDKPELIMHNKAFYKFV